MKTDEQRFDEHFDLDNDLFLGIYSPSLVLKKAFPLDYNLMLNEWLKEEEMSQEYEIDELDLIDP